MGGCLPELGGSLARASSHSLSQDGETTVSWAVACRVCPARREVESGEGDPARPPGLLEEAVVGP